MSASGSREHLPYRLRRGAPELVAEQRAPDAEPELPDLEPCVPLPRDMFEMLTHTSVTVNLPASTTVQYKYIRKNNGAVTWESDPNRQISVPASGSYTANDSWR